MGLPRHLALADLLCRGPGWFYGIQMFFLTCVHI